VVARRPDQVERRRRVIEAALELAREGGYDAVQMRDVALRAEVALGTIYRYFASKDHLLIAAAITWNDELQSRLARRPPTSDDPADRVVNVLRRMCRTAERDPSVARAFVQAYSSGDPRVSEATGQVGNQLREILEPLLADLEEPDRDGVVAVIRHVWFSSLMMWAGGQMAITTVADELERAVRLVMPATAARTRRAVARG
jgi:AcrR family transcriptional regulator